MKKLYSENLERAYLQKKINFVFNQEISKNIYIRKSSVQISAKAN